MKKSSKDLILKLEGRFGNQLFQLLAATYAQQELDYQIQIFAKHLRPKHIYLLHKSGVAKNFEISFSFFQRKYIEGKMTGRIADFFIASVRFTAYRFTTKLSYTSKIRMRRKPVQFLESTEWKRLPSISGTAYGFFQDGALVDRFWDDLTNIFDLSGLNFFPNSDYNVVHVRLADYLYHPEIGILNEEYFLNSLKQSPTRPTYLLTDDFEKCSQLYPILSQNCIRANFLRDDLQVFDFMVGAKAIIISNSTFSYWAGVFALRKNSTGLVIAPNPWREDGKYQEILSSRFQILPR